MINKMIYSNFKTSLMTIFVKIKLAAYQNLAMMSMTILTELCSEKCHTVLTMCKASVNARVHEV